MASLESRVSELKKVLSSNDYRKAAAAVDALRSRVAKATKADLQSLAKEKERLFSGLKASSPKVYEVLRIEEKTISEEIIFKATGNRVILD